MMFQIQGEQLYRVLYDYAYSTGTRREDEQVTDSRLNRMREMANKGKHYSNIVVIEVLGFEDRTWWETWYKLGMANTWICKAHDPEFRRDAFVECKSIDYLINRMEHGNWCLGTAFFYRDICFINQDDGGSEWLVIRKGIVFESWSIGHVLKERNGKTRFKDTLNRMLAASDTQLQKGEYMDAGPICHCSHCNRKIYPGSHEIYKDVTGDTCEVCWRDKKIYKHAIESKVRMNQKLNAEDLRFLVYEDHFVIVGEKELEGWFICWNDQFSIGKSPFEEHKIDIYSKMGDGSWYLVDSYYAK